MRALALVIFTLFVAGCGTAKRCRPDSCTGCCTADDQCVAGTSTAQCGAGGNLCDVCVASQVCGASGRCATSMLATDSGVDAGEPAMDAGVDGGSTTGPITATAETWTWVDFPESRCGRGTPTGIGVNLTTRSNDVIVFLEGGGACWNDLTCNLGFAQNLGGYNATTFTNEPARFSPAFNRANMNNPFRNASYVYVPYCTGDVHAGDRLAPYGIHHRGAANVRAYLARLKDTFPQAARIWLTGSSAGGYGVQLNYHRFSEAFPNAEIHGLADSAQMLNPADPAQLSEWVTAWNISDPPGCAGCTSDFTQVPGRLAAMYPNRRFALLAFSRDQVLLQFFNYADQNAFAQQTTNLLMSQYENKANLKYFVVDPPAPAHVMLDELFVRNAGGTSLSSFVRAWAFGEPTWANVRGN